MAAHVSSYSPHVSGRGNHPHHTPRRTQGRGGSAAHGGITLFGLVLLVAFTLPRSETPTSAGSANASLTNIAIDQSPIPFSVQAQGLTEREVPLFNAPGAAAPSRHLPSGAAVEIGGQLRVASGLGLHALNWVRVADTEGSHYGFVAADAVRITAGEPALLDSSDLRPERWSRPQEAASYIGGKQLVAPEGGTSSVTSLSATGHAAAPAIAWMPQSVRRWWADITRISQRHHVDPELVAILILVESGGDPEARSSAGATGLMQLMPATAIEVAQQLGMRDFGLDRLTDPVTNIELGTAYISQQLARFGQAADPDWQTSVELAAAAYNGGPGTVLAMRAGTRRLPAETSRYVDWVGGMWRDRRLSESATFGRWWAAGGQRLVLAADHRVALNR
jgi:soluble lytic murein transglycosylase-like protein